MATVNRFTQLQPSRYNPMSLQELMLVPAYKRQQHDAISENIAKTESALANIDPLQVHSELAKTEQKKLYDQLQLQAEMLQKEGFTPQSKSQFLNLYKQYQQAVSPTGTLGKIQAAKQSFEEEKNNYISNATKLGYSPEIAALNWEDHYNKYQQKFLDDNKIENINSLYSPNYFNYIEEAQKLFKDAGITANDIGRENSKIISDSKGNYILNTNHRDVNESNIKQLESAVEFLNNRILNPNSDAHQSIIHQRKNPSNVINELFGLDKVYQKSSVLDHNSTNITNYSPNELGLTDVDPNDVPAYEEKEEETITVFNDSLINSLNDIYEENPVPKSLQYDSNKGTGTAMSGQTFVGPSLEKSTFENRLNTKEKEEYNKVFNKLKDVYPSLQKLNPTDPEAINIVRQYVIDNKNILRHNILITDDYITDYGDTSIGLNKTDKDKISEYIIDHRSERSYEINGKIYNTYDDLPSDIKKNFKTFKYKGYYSPKNFLTDQYGKKENKELFVSPIEGYIEDDEGNIINMKVSRSSSERASKSYQADYIFNDIFVNTNKYPNTAYQFGDSYIMYLPQAPNNMKYLINSKDSSGSFGPPAYLSENQLHSKIYEGMGVKSKRDK